MSLLLVEHDVAMVLGLSSEVAVLDFGVRIAYGTPDRSATTLRCAPRTSATTKPSRARGTKEARPDGRRTALGAGLNVHYASVQALFDVRIDVPEGRIVAVLGANGAGKSTLRPRRCRASCRRSRAGSCSTARTSPRRHRTRSVAPGSCTSPRVAGSSRASRCRRTCGWPCGASARRDQRKSAIEHAYDMFPRLAERRSQRAGTLSGGEQQMLALGPRARGAAEADHRRRDVARSRAARGRLRCSRASSRPRRTA